MRQFPVATSDLPLYYLHAYDALSLKLDMHFYSQDDICVNDTHIFILTPKGIDNAKNGHVISP